MQPASTDRQVPESMRAAVLFGPNDLRVVQRPVPIPGPGEVLVKVAALRHLWHRPQAGGQSYAP